ncbi:MAG: ERCC4 domain-containing protein [Candidatus Kariarchaeaceae archaeon]|jgi:Fanconi anemia group M protein
MVLSILADHREPSDIIQELRQLGVKVDVQQLSMGDYILSNEVIVERKSGRDFIQSLYDNRLFDQAHRLIEEYDQVIYVLENFSIDPTEFKPIYGALAYLSIRKGVPVLPTNSSYETAALLERLTSWVQEEHTDPILSRGGPKRMTTRDKQIYLLQGLEGVGIKTSEKLLDEVGTPRNIFQEIDAAEIKYTRTGNVKGVSGVFAEIKGIGPSFVINNKKVLNE